MITAISADGTDVRVFDEGQGPGILVLGPGMDDGSAWKRVAARLSSRFRVIRLHRRQYRADIKAGSPCTMAQEVDDILVVAKVVGEPLVLVGHSSGGVVVLEAMAASPATFAGAVIYEPPVVIGPPLGGEALACARAADDAGKPGKALAIFSRDVVGVPPLVAWLSGVLVAALPRWRALVSHQLDDLEAIDQLGVRLDAYARIEVPTVLLGGDRSPPHLGERLDTLARTMPHAEKEVLHRQGHGAHRAAPDKVARVIEALTDKVLHQP